MKVQSTGEFEAITRLAQFVLNVSELRRMAGQVLDIVFASGHARVQAARDEKAARR